MATILNRHRRLAPLAVATAVLASACGAIPGGSDRSAPATESSVAAPTTASSTETSSVTAPETSTTRPASTTSAPPPSVESAALDEDVIADSVDDFLARWGARNRLLAAQEDGGWEKVNLVPSAVVVGEPVGAYRAFGVRTDDGILLGGAVEVATGAVHSVIVAYRPDGSALGASAVFTTLGTAGIPTDPAFDDVLQAYQEVATDPDVENAYVASGGRSFVIEDFPTADGGAIVQMTVLLGTGEAAAFDAVPGIQIEVGKLFDA